MSGGQDVLGIVAGGASLLSLSVQLAESAATLKGLYHDTRDAPEALNVLAHGIETVSLDLKLIERKGQSEACGADLLSQCLERCQRHAADIQQLTDRLSLKIGRVFLFSNVDTVVREQVLDMLLDDLDHTQNTLQQDVLEFHRQEMARRWRLRATSSLQPTRGHEYSNIAVRDHARLHIGDVYTTNYMYGPPSQQAVADLEIRASTRQKQLVDSHRLIRENEDGPHRGDQRSTVMQRTVQTYTDNLTREFGLIVQRTQASLIQELDAVPPSLIRPDRPEKSDEIASNSAGRRRSRNTKNVAFRLRLKVPAWFSTRVWEIAKVDAQQGWDLCFRTFNQRPNALHVFWDCRLGNLHALKQLIQAGEASLLDVDGSGGNLFAVSIVLSDIYAQS
jgi:hypothetical protein